MMETGFSFVFFSYSLQHTSHDFENNRKTMLTEKNHTLLSWVVSQPPPYAQKKSALCVVPRREQIVEASLKIRYFDFNKRSYSINL